MQVDDRRALNNWDIGGLHGQESEEGEEGGKEEEGRQEEVVSPQQSRKTRAETHQGACALPSQSR
jgi:hypothetical protein